MTVQQTNSSVRYTGDGSQAEYDYNFRIFNDDNMKVYVDNVLMAQVTDYTLTNNGDETGGTVTFVIPPADQSAVVLERVLEYQQLLDLIAYDKFPAESVESALDWIVYLAQQNANALNRALKADVSMPEDTDTTVPPPGAGEFFKYTDDGMAIETADINNLGDTVVAGATDQEIIDGIQTQKRLVSPYQTALAVTAHQNNPPDSVFDVPYIEVVDALPGTPSPGILYLVRE